MASVAAPSGNRDKIDYGALLARAADGKVDNVKVDNTNGHITGQLTDGTKFSTTGPIPLPEADNALLLQKVSKIPVLEISDDLKVVPDHIYIIPSNKMLVAYDGVLKLSPRILNKGERNLPIDSKQMLRAIGFHISPHSARGL